MADHQSSASDSSETPRRKSSRKSTTTAAPRKTGATAAAAAKKKTTTKKASSGTARATASTKTTPTKKAPARKAAPRKTAATAKKAPATEAPAAKAADAEPAKPSPATPPAKETSSQDDTPIFTDMARFAEYMADINLATRDILEDIAERRALTGRRGAETPPDPLNVSEAGSEVAAALQAKPLKLMQAQLGLWDGYARLFTNTMEKMAGAQVEPVAAPGPGDKRFTHKAWEENPMLDFIKQSYLLFSDWVTQTINQTEGVDEATKRRAYFHADQFLAAMSPSNNPTLNPAVVDEAIQTQGTNFLAGLKNFMEDLERGHGELAIRQADLDFFKVGENLATTPGKVVYQNNLMQLIQYTPTTEKVAKRPMVIFPPWINKFYILDLQKENSFIRWLVDQGRTVFVVSWINPGVELKDKSFPDYMREGVFEALEVIERATGEKEFDTIGYCIGGTLLAVTLAYMKHHGDERIKTATFFTAQTDFAEAGDLALFVDEKQLANLEKQIDASGGVLEGEAMARTFNMLRPNDLIWSAFVDNYYLGKPAKKFDLLFWNADATRMTKACHLYYLRNFYLENRLSRGELDIEGTPIDLSTVDIPIFMQAGERDHIAPPNSVFRSAKLFAGDVRYMLAGSGHIAGVINHPDKQKYHYSTNDKLPETLEEWKESAERHDYSWWPYWIKWLDSHSPEQVPARDPEDGPLPVLEDAPGSYVKVRSD